MLTALWLVLTWPLQPVGRNAGEGGARTLAQLQERLDILADDAVERGDERAEAILGALADWAEHLGADLG